ncbi:MAG: hypothetical protein J6J35_02440 [Alphaproteobacteria bacterium]|nr:hypothetical protein [Alphaproteobacteria bacterium]
MSMKSVKAYANFPVQLKIEKDRYWYINELVSVKQNTSIVKNLQLFEGFEYQLSPNRLDEVRMCPPAIEFQEGELWNFSSFMGGHGVLAPKGKTYYCSNCVFDNLLKRGNPVISSNGILSDISAANNIYTTFNPGSNLWKIVMWVHTPAEGFSNGECLFGHYSTAYAAPKLCVDDTNHLVLSLASSTSGYDIANGIVSDQTLSLDKDYKISLEFDGNKYTLKAGYNSGSTQTWTEVTHIEVQSSVAVYGAANQFCIGYCNGGVPWSGTINLFKTEIFINGASAWRPYHLMSFIDKGILDITTDDGQAATYSVFVKNDGTVEMSLSDEDKEGFYWAGTIGIPAHSSYKLYLAHFDMVGDENVTISDNKASDFSSTKYLKFNFNKLSEYFDQPYSILSKFTYSSASSYQGGMYNSTNSKQLFMISGGKIALNDGSARGLVAITNGKTYWVFGNYVLDDGYSLYFIEDNGYTEATLPALSEWTFVYKTTVAMLGNGEIWLGNNQSSQYWRGNIDLEHTCIKSNEVVLWRPFTEV